MAAERRGDLEGQARLGPVIDDLEPNRRFGRHDALKIERMNAAEERRQIEALAPACYHPVDLYHSGQNRSIGKVAAEIKQVARRNELEYRLMRIFFDQAFTRLGRSINPAIEQGGKLGNGS